MGADVLNEGSDAVGAHGHTHTWDAKFKVANKEEEEYNPGYQNQMMNDTMNQAMNQYARGNSPAAMGHDQSQQ